MRSTVRGIDARAVHAWDGFVMFWVVLWIVLGALTGVTLWQAADTGDTISTSGQALQSAGAGLQGLADIPLIGERPGTIGDEVVATGKDVAERGQLMKGQLRRLAILLGIAVIFIPITPVAGFYLPVRRSWSRQRKDLARALAEHGDHPALDGYLAVRARVHLAYSDVARLVSQGDGERNLADAELDRLGLTRPAGPESG